MSIRCFSIPGPEYPISCKLFAPDAASPRLLVLGVHGFAGDKESSALAGLARRLLQQNSALLCFDFPAHGESEAPDAALTVENCIRDLLAVANHGRQLFPGVPTALFATSFGGYISLLALDRLAPQPTRLVLRAPAVKMASVFRDRILGDQFEAYRRDGSVLSGFERTMQVPWAFYQGLQSFDAFSVRPAPPALIIRALQDELIEPADLAAFAARCPNARLLDVPTADHRFKGPGELDTALDGAMDWLFSAG